jgi:uncharacterized membrane protein YhaH (DUF805 family)
MEKTVWQWMIEPLRKYATFSGRARRKEYWWFAVLSAIVTIVAMAVDIAVFGIDAVATDGRRYVQGVVSLALLLPTQAVLVRRLHDLGRSGWLLLGYYIAVVVLVAFALKVAAAGDQPQTIWIVLLCVMALAVLALGIIMFVWFCQRGTIGDNRFGPDPLAGPEE